LIDADGGIQVDGIRYWYTANLTDNTIGQSAGRVAPSAVDFGLKIVVHPLLTP
jgi:hypothetical protein